MQHLVEVRPLREADIDRLVDVLSAVAGERLWITTEPGFDPGLYRSRWRRLVRGEGGTSFVAVRDDAPIGMLNIYPHDEYGHIIGMFVDAGHRGSGVGTALIDAALSWARSSGLESISLLVFPHNARALAVYRKAGFEEREYFPLDVPRASGEVWDSLLMTKIL